MAPVLELVFAGVCLLTVVLLAWLAWRATTRFANVPLRWLTRLAAVPLIGWCGPAAAGHVAFAPRDAGTWMCTACLSQREEVRYLGWTLSIGDPEPPSTYQVKEGACNANGHDWKPVGCHQVGLWTIACSFYPIASGNEAAPSSSALAADEQ